MKKSINPSKTQLISISQFKAEALKLLADTAKRGQEYIVTKKGIPIAKVGPISRRSDKRRGSLKGLISIKGDIVQSDSSNEWEVLK